MAENVREIRFYKGICRTPALKLAVEGWHHLLSEGLVEEVTMVGWDDRALVAFDGAEAVGVLTYSYPDWAKQYSIQVGYVRPAYRKQGVYQALWEELVRRAKEEKVPNIESSTAMNNAAMRAQAAKMGRMERGVMLSYRTGV